MIKILVVVSTLRASGPTNQLFNIINNIELRIFKPVLVTLSPEGKNSKWGDYEKLPIDMYSLGMSRFQGIIFGKSKLSSLLHKIKPDLIHTQGIRADALLSSIPMLSRWVLTARNYPYEDYPMKFGWLRGSIMARQHIAYQKKCTHVIACSKAIQLQLKQVGIDSNVIQNGVDLPNYKRDIANVFSLERPVFITVGSLIPRKNTRLLVDTFKLWKTSSKKSGSLLIVGSGAEYDSLKLSASTSIRFVGETSCVADYLRVADYFISASLSEGLPNTVLEALATGLPVILSDIPSHQEIYEECRGASLMFKLSEGQNGLLNVFDNVTNIFSSHARYDAIRVSSEVFSARVMAQRYQDYYFNILENM
jgi:glycosyltransferase involved in cell wall biosynthesis